MAEGNAERKEVEDYLRRHNLQSVMNEVINSIIKERAEFPLDAIARKLQDRDERGIIEVLGREVLDASGRPTVCVDVKTSRGVFSASVPRAPPAEFGAKELADVDVERYAGGGTTMAVKMVRPPESRAVRAHAHSTDTLTCACIGRGGGAVPQINEQIGPALVGIDARDQKAVDKKLGDLDGTEDRSRFGANAMLATSMAVARAGAAAAKKPLFRHLADLAGVEEVCMPVPAFTVIEGGTNAYVNLPFKVSVLVLSRRGRTWRLTAWRPLLHRRFSSCPLALRRSLRRYVLAWKCTPR